MKRPSGHQRFDEDLKTTSPMCQMAGRVTTSFGGKISRKKVMTCPRRCNGATQVNNINAPYAEVRDINETESAN